MDTTAAETPWPRTRTQKKLLGALTVWPPVYIILFMVFIFGSMLVSFGGVGLLGVAGAASGGLEGGSPPELGTGGGLLAGLAGFLFMLPFILFPLVFVLHGLTMLLIFGLLGYFCHHVYNNRSLPDNDRLMMFMVVLFLGGMGGFTWYWYQHIWQEGADAPPAARPLATTMEPEAASMIPDSMPPSSVPADDATT